MKNILIVEDSEVVIKVLRHLMAQFPDYRAVFTSNMAQVEAVLNHANSDIFAALVDSNRSDSPNDDVINYLLTKKISTILFVGVEDIGKCEQYFERGIVDYVMKEGRHAYNHAISLIERLEKNQQIKVMVVDEVEESRKQLLELLNRHLYKVVEAKDGIEAVKMLLESPDIKLLIVEQNMRRMDGFELVRNLRYKYNQTELVVIGMASNSAPALSVRFIKHGANDFLVKPIQPEEFYYRIANNLESCELNNRITWLTQRDHLTGIYHRQYFFDTAQDIYAQTEEKASPLALAIISVDQFIQISEKYGHEWEDVAIKHVADILQNMLGRFLLCRADRNDFYVLLPGLDNEKAVSFISRVRQLLSAEECNINGVQERFYFSSGVSNKSNEGVDEHIKKSFHLLQLAKEAGGNMVLGDDDEENN